MFWTFMAILYLMIGSQVWVWGTIIRYILACWRSDLVSCTPKGALAEFWLPNFFLFFLLWPVALLFATVEVLNRVLYYKWAATCGNLAGNDSWLAKWIESKKPTWMILVILAMGACTGCSQSIQTEASPGAPIASYTVTSEDYPLDNWSRVRVISIKNNANPSVEPSKYFIYSGANGGVCNLK